MFLRKVTTEFIIAILITIFVMGNFFSCSAPSKPEKNNSNITLMSDILTLEKENTTLQNDVTTTVVDSIISQSDMTTYAEDMTVYAKDFIYYQFGESIDNVYVANLQNQEYIDAHIILPNGKQLDLVKIIRDVAVGEGVLLIAAVVFSAIPGGQPITAIIITWHQTAMVGAAFGAAITGITEYVASGGNIESTFDRALEGAADGYKWGAITSVGATAVQTIKIAKTGTQSKNVFANFAENYADDATSIVSKTDDVARLISSTDDSARAITKKEFLTKYGGKIDDFKSYSGKSFDRWNKMKRGLIPENQDDIRRINNIDTVLRSESTTSPLVLSRGINCSESELSSIFNARNLFDGHGKLIRENLIKRQSFEPALMSTSLNKKTAANFASGMFNTEYNPSNLKIIRTINAPKGTHGLNISKISVNGHEGEFLLPTGQKTEVIDAFVDTNGWIHIIENLI